MGLKRICKGKLMEHLKNHKIITEKMEARKRRINLAVFLGTTIFAIIVLQVIEYILNGGF